MGTPAPTTRQDHDTVTRGCSRPVRLDHVVLPILDGTGAARVRKSTRTRWRVAVLLAVHFLIAAHVAHFVVRGRTLSPIEPSESMYTLENGFINAGFIFFGVALLGTLVFGRFFCGWGCHILALQDLCAALLRRAGFG